MSLFSFFGFAQSTKEKKSLTEEQYKILPILKVNIDKNDSSKTISFPKANEPIIDSFIVDLVILYGIDKGSHYIFVNNKKLKELRLTQSNLKELAINNLTNLIDAGEVKMRGDTNYGILTFDGNQEATLLLLNNFWTNIEDLYKGKDFLVAIPSRDVLLLADPNSESGVQQMKNSINKIIKTGDHTLTRWILKRKNHKWEPFIKVTE